MLLTSSRFEKLCDSIFALDRSIRFAGVIDKMGNLVAGGMRKGVRPLEPKEERRKLYLEYALRNAMRQDFDSKFGRVIYTLSEREKVKLASFPISDSLVLVSIDKKGEHTKIISRIVRLVSAY
ncbi:MAG: DUF6659 family protein [Nitrososphaera sp.]